jgi:hypothetical protein
MDMLDPLHVGGGGRLIVGQSAGVVMLGSS